MSIAYKDSRFLQPISMLYSLLLMFVIIFTNKGMHYPFINFASVTLPFTIILFVLGDITTEVYGYRKTLNIIIQSAILVIIFTIVAALISKITPTYVPTEWQQGTDQSAYYQVFRKTPFYMATYIFSFLIATYLNIRVISRWKILFNGRYFWLRSIGASGIGAFVFCILDRLDHFLIAPHYPFSEIVSLTVFSFFTKIIGFIILAYPANFIVRLLKAAENINTYDYYENYNPFKKAPELK